MKKQYIAPSLIEVMLQGVGMVAAVSSAQISTNDSGYPYGEGLGNFGGDGDAWNDAAVKGNTSIWDEEW